MRLYEHIFPESGGESQDKGAKESREAEAKKEAKEAERREEERKEQLREAEKREKEEKDAERCGVKRRESSERILFLCAVLGSREADMERGAKPFPWRVASHRSDRERI